MEAKEELAAIDRNIAMANAFSDQCKARIYDNELKILAAQNQITALEQVRKRMLEEIAKAAHSEPVMSNDEDATKDPN